MTKVWQGMEWHKTEEGGTKGVTVGILKQFLEEMGLPGGNSGKRAETFNGLLRENGFTGQLWEAKLKDKTGSPPWVGTKDTFRAVYGFL